MSCSNCGCKAKLSPCAFGFAMGLVKGLWLMLLAWAAWLFGYGMPMVEHMASFCHYYGASLMGGLVGGLYGFICGYIFGFIFAYVYNCCFCFKKCGASCDKNACK